MKSIFTKNGQIYFFIIAIIMAYCFQTGHADIAALVTTDKDSYKYGEVIKVNYSNAPGKESDWICIVSEGSPDTEAGDYQNMPKELAHGVLTFNSPAPGKYEARAYFDYSKKGYVVSARHSFLVTSTPESEKDIANSSSYKEGTIIKIFDAPGYSKNQIFDGAKIWISENFRSAKAVLEYENKDTGTIIGNGIIPYPCQGWSCIGTGDWKVSFTMRVDIKDQKFRLTFTNLGLSWPSVPGRPATSNERIGRDSSFNNVKDKLSDFGNQMLESFKQDKSKDNW
jgi:hypothetical protein